MKKPQGPNSLPARILIGIFSSIFGGVGLKLLVFLWGSPTGGFHSPPLFFRIFGSFIAIGFVAFSAFGLFAVITGATGPQLPDQTSLNSELRNQNFNASSSGSFSCPSCGSGLGAESEVSPSGDVKCAHCNNWYNVRQT